MASKKDEKAVAPLLVSDDVQAEAEDRELDLDQQARALVEYKLTGVNRGYIDQSRDQEPDIGPNFGESPHPELFNPEPHADAIVVGAPQGGLPGIGEKSNSPLVDNSDEAKERREAAADAKVEEAVARQEIPPAVAAGVAQPVVVVDDRSDEAKAQREEAEKQAEEARKDSEEK